MPDYEQTIFISYAWGEETHEREAIVNQLDQSLQKRGLKIVRDKRDLGYKGSIGKFMERIGAGDCVIVVISDKYLRSKNCMFELVEIAEGKQFSERIFPIILKDANIYDALGQLDYVEHWDKQKSALNERIRSLPDQSNLQGIREELDNYDRFRDEIAKLTTTLKDMNTLTADMHREADFQQLYDELVKRMPALTSKEKPAIKKERKPMDKDESPRPVSQTNNFGGDQNIMSGSITSGGIFAQGRDAKVIVNQYHGVDAKELTGLFEKLYQHIDARPADPNIDKEEIVDTIKKIEAEASKGEEANESKLGRWMGTLNKMAPDILDVALASLGGPVSGVTALLKKIADHAKQA